MSKKSKKLNTFSHSIVVRYFMSEKELITKKAKWKKVVQLTAAYLVAAWTFLQFVDWILVRYQISPYWVDILLWLFLGILPSFMICIFNLERISQGTLKLREKIIVPLNVLILGALLFLFFGNSDLGSTTKEISYTDDFGNVSTQTITKEEFRISFPVFNFEQIKKDSVHEWLGETINKLLTLDLDQDKNISASTAYADNTTDKVKISSIFNEFYIDGKYTVEKDIYTITPVIRNSKNGIELKRKTFSGDDFFSLIDQMSVYIKNNVGLVEEMTNQYIDLDISEITTESMDALQLWMDEDYEGAVEIDDEFTLAYFYNAVRRNRYSQGELEEKYLIDKAYQLKSKLPSQIQFEILMYKHIVYERWEDAKELIKYQLEYEPENETFNYLLDIVYSETQDIDAIYERASNRFAKNRNEDTAKDYFTSLIFKNKFKEALSLVKTFELLAPNVEDVQIVKAYTYLNTGDFDKAKEIYKRMDITWPKETHYKRVAREFIEHHKGDEKIDPNIFNYSYRSTQSEQQVNYFTNENVLFVSYKNQRLWKGFVMDKDSLIVLSPGDHFGLKHRFERDSKGSIYRVKCDQFSGKVLTTFYYYVEPEPIKDAYGAFKKHQYKGLETQFEKLVKAYPNHWYLKDALQHLQFVKSKSTETLLKQYEKVVGIYANRKFWVQDNKLYYKREGLTKVELFPISENKYIALSKLDTRYEFEFLKGGQIASFAWTYSLQDDEWNPMKDENNYLIKD